MNTFMASVDVNFVVVLVAAIVHFVIGALWYSPILFGNAWMKHMKKKKEDLGKPGPSMLIGFVATLVSVYVLSHIVTFSQATSFAEGAQSGFWVWLGFVVPTSLSAVLWEGKKLPLFWIYVSNSLVGLVLAGGILASWM